MPDSGSKEHETGETAESGTVPHGGTTGTRTGPPGGLAPGDHGRRSPGPESFWGSASGRTGQLPETD
ncbi:hypothetical protein GCM10009716_45560 [Streptomyces sodiiphilus]|uniref:Uncharacterized protein n=1 Tax=Streptomyces sodiiphilus TaxID=226217 RepID=A0ABP5B8I6_9ACTN